MKVERTTEIRWRLPGGCVLLLLAVLFSADASIPRDAASFSITHQVSKLLSNGSQQTQALTWDGAGRLVKVSQRDASTNNGYDWTALYDGLGRRLRAVYTPVQTNTLCSSLSVAQESWYDPQVEFLEIGVALNGQKQAKLYGPDLDGVYGGLQGIGGLEATIKQSDGSVTPVVSDAFGNVVASVGTNVSWNVTRVGGYGPLPNNSARWWSTNTTLAASTVWRGKRMDPTGYYWSGARYYDPVGGRFLSPDPLGHEASMDLYSYAKGDPINFCDPDGRFGKKVEAFGQTVRENMPALFGVPWGRTFEAFGADVQLAAGMMSFDSVSVSENARKGFEYRLGAYGLKEAFTEGSWVSGRTGGVLPASLAGAIVDVERKYVPTDAWMNGMHAWHAGSNAEISSRLGPFAAPLQWVAGVIHETPLDWGSFWTEQRDQGTVNHVFDSIGDIVANTHGIAIGLLLPPKMAAGFAAYSGNYIPGPGEPDPTFGGGTGRYKGEPSDAWGQYPK